VRDCEGEGVLDGALEIDGVTVGVGKTEGVTVKELKTYSRVTEAEEGPTVLPGVAARAA
jgi:hypothetical protein